MSETKHTPGPWKAHKTNQARSGVPEFEIHWSDIGECVAEIVHGEADARLIAAAPELLAACQAFSALYGRLWDTVEPKGGGFLGADSVSKYDEVHAQMSAAIAKATGSAA